MKKRADYLLTKESFGDNCSLPDWLVKEYNHFEKIVTRSDFPCTFGIAGQNRGELRYSYITHNDWSHLPKTMRTFADLFERQDKLIRHGLFLFVEPEKEEKTIPYYKQYFWDVLQYLHDHDDQKWPEDFPHDPDHHLWTFIFADESYFAFGNAPAYKQRKTRDLGNSLIIGFQPRRIFKGLEGTSQSGKMSRKKIRARVEQWDGLPTHPNISHYGDKHHREWKQYFIGDDMERIEGTCPFRYNKV